MITLQSPHVHPHALCCTAHIPAKVRQLFSVFARKTETDLLTHGQTLVKNNT